MRTGWISCKIKVNGCQGISANDIANLEAAKDVIIANAVTEKYDQARHVDLAAANHRLYKTI